MIFGLAITFLTPPFQTPDEYLHFYRAFQISEGQLVAERQTGDCYGYSKYFETEVCLGGNLPKSVLTTVRNVSTRDLRFDINQKQDINEIFAVLDLPLNPENRVFINFKTTALHSPIPYLPQALGISIGKLFKISPLKLMYLGRLTNLLFWLGLVSFGIYWSPIHRGLLMMLALTPMSLCLASSLSLDALTNGVAFAFVGLVLRVAMGGERGIERNSRERNSRERNKLNLAWPWFFKKIESVVGANGRSSRRLNSPKNEIHENLKSGDIELGSSTPPTKFQANRKNTVIDIAILGGLAVVLSLSKLAYFPLVLLLLAIPRRNLGSWRRYWGSLSAIVLASGGAVALWSGVVSRIYVSLHPQLSPSDQIQLVLSHPLGFAATVMRTLAAFGGDYAHQFIGVLGWLDTPLPGWLVMAYWGVLAVTVGVATPADKRLQGWQRGVFAVSALSSMVMLCGLAYLWNFVGAEMIGGLQGRYWIPIAPVAGLVFYNRRFRGWSKGFYRFGVGFVLFSCTVTLAVLFDRYY
ncbi:DUF2142 domain-containing protein [Baaleninema sp.]|uniref:DUF2142 domain-containing protein n=1 Tax=Baaleninema sp. TaxID=3101197 RepID=UPI003D056FF1